jgi:hypothetical protein
VNTVLTLNTPLDTCTCETWHLTPGSHLAVALDRHTVASPVRVRRGTFQVDPTIGVGSLTIELAVGGGGTLRAAATSGGRDDHGIAIWTVRGTLAMGGRTTQIGLRLRDHGVIRTTGTWWWLSGTGDEQRRERRRPRHGSRLVADLILAP